MDARSSKRRLSERSSASAVEDEPEKRHAPDQYSGSGARSGFRGVGIHHSGSGNMSVGRDLIIKGSDVDNISKLPVARGAAFDSQVHEHDPKCYPGTRVVLLADICKWVKDQQGKCIFWLRGMAGTGKSTISRTVAAYLSKEKVPSASFFFKKGEGDRGKAAMFFTTISFQLVHQLPPLALHVQSAIENDPAIIDKAKIEQFEKLILEPLDKCKNDPRIPTLIVVVIDALDECDREDDAKAIIRLLSKAQELNSTRLRFFVTSRPELPIQLGFRSIDGIYKDLALHEVPKPDIKRDISTYLSFRLAEIRADFNKTVPNPGLPHDWPSAASFESLVNMAVPLFIFASTACRFIADSDCGDPTEQLDELLTCQKKGGWSQLHTTYLPVLSRLLLKRTDSGLVSRTEDEKAKIIAWFHEIVDTIVLLADPLPTVSLARVLRRTQRYIDSRLRGLHSVLYIPDDPRTPVRMLHLSFRDFLINHENRDISPFWINERETHERLAALCLQLLGDTLKKDICGLQLPGTCRSEIDQKIIDTSLPPEVQYACRYWVYHWKESKRLIRYGDVVNGFLTRHLLHWLEALGLLGRISESIRMVDDLLGLLDPEENGNVSMFLHDTRRIILNHLSVIHISPLQVYYSAIVFAPERSIVRKTFRNQFPAWFSLLPQTDSDWDACSHTLEGHNGWVSSVIFSHDSTMLASASSDGTIKLWDTTTGTCIATLRGHNKPVISVALFRDSTMLASVSSDNTIKLWDTATGTCTATRTCYVGTVISNAVAFSHDCTMLASASDDETIIKLWDIATETYTATLKGHSEKVSSVAFSYDSAMLASASNKDNTIKLWDMATKTCTATLKGFKSVAFSHNSTILALASYNGTIKLWDKATGTYTATFKGHDSFVNSIAFSHDSTMLASVPYDETIKLWDIATGTCISTFKGHNNAVTSIVFSHDSTTLASASDDNNIKLWDTTIGTYTTTLQGYTKAVTVVVISHNSAILASASRDKTIQLWDIATGTNTATLNGHSDKVTFVAFSHDSAILASASYDRTIKLWDIATGTYTATLNGHSNVVTFVVFSHDSAILASASWDSTIKLWDLAAGTCTATLEDRNNLFDSVAFSHDSTLLASCSFPTVKLWDRVTGTCVNTLRPNLYATSVAFSHNPTMLAIASDDGNVQLWDTETDTGTVILSVGRGVRLKHLAFDATGSSLYTDVGAFTLSSPPSSPSPPLSSTSASSATSLPTLVSTANRLPHCVGRQGVGISEDGAWITWESHKLLWLPPAYRRGESTVMASTVAIGCMSGRIVLMTFSTVQLQRLFAPDASKRAALNI